MLCVSREATLEAEMIKRTAAIITRHAPDDRLRKAAEELLADFKEATGPNGLRKASFTQYVIQSLDKWDALTTALPLSKGGVAK